MASSLFGNQSQQSNVTNLLQQFGDFRRSLGNQDPRAIVQGLISSGKMSQQQFDQLAGMATELQKILK